MSCLPRLPRAGCRAALALPVCLVATVGLLAAVGTKPRDEKTAASAEVRVIRGIEYCDGFTIAPRRHRLDLFLPAECKKAPVVFVVHGGAWIVGNNRCLGYYSAIGEFLAKNGYIAVLPNYRLSPWVQHPEHIKDIAAAYAWTYDRIAEYGGCPDRIVLMGHSAGGHLVSLLAADDHYLKAQGLDARDIRGVISISGVYRIPQGKFVVTLGGVSSISFHPRQIVPLRSQAEDRCGCEPAKMGPDLAIDVFGPAFGDDPEVRDDASPIKHVCAGLPPFLIAYAERELPSLPGMARAFHRALLEHKNRSELLKIAGRNHNSAYFQMTDPGDELGRRVLEFLKQVAHE